MGAACQWLRERRRGRVRLAVREIEGESAHVGWLGLVAYAAEG